MLFRTLYYYHDVLCWYGISNWVPPNFYPPNQFLDTELNYVHTLDVLCDGVQYYASFKLCDNSVADPTHHA